MTTLTNRDFQPNNIVSADGVVTISDNEKFKCNERDYWLALGDNLSGVLITEKSLLDFDFVKNDLFDDLTYEKDIVRLTYNPATSEWAVLFFSLTTEIPTTTVFSYVNELQNFWYATFKVELGA